MERTLVKYCFTSKKTELAHMDYMVPYYNHIITKLESDGIINAILMHETENPFDFEKSFCNYVIENVMTYVYSFSCNEIRGEETVTFNFSIKFTYETHGVAEILYIEICSENYTFDSRSDSNCLEILKHQLRKELYGWKNRYCLQDLQSQYYASTLYPRIHETENIFRYYVNDVYIKIFGNNWWDETVAKNLRESKKERIEDTRNLAGEYKDIQPYLLSLEWNDLMNLANMKSEEWKPSYDSTIEKVLNGILKGDIISLLKKQCVPKIDLWKMCFEKHLPEDFSDKYHRLEKRRNQVAHNKLLTNASFHEVLALCDDVKDTLQEAHSKFCQEYISEEEQILIDEYKAELEQEKEMELDALNAIAEEESGVTVHSHESITGILIDAMSDIYNEITAVFEERNDIEISDCNTADMDITHTDIFSIAYKLKNKAINVSCAINVDASAGQISTLSVSFGLDGEAIKTEHHTIKFVNGEYSFNEYQSNYMPEAVDELSEEDVLTTIEALSKFIEDSFPNLRAMADLHNHLDAMGKAASIVESDVYCCECGEEYICIDSDYAPVGTCLNCGSQNYILYCTHCGCPIDALDDEADEVVHYCTSCNEKLFESD